MPTGHDVERYRDEHGIYDSNRHYSTDNWVTHHEDTDDDNARVCCYEPEFLAAFLEKGFVICPYFYATMEKTSFYLDNVVCESIRREVGTDGRSSSARVEARGVDALTRFVCVSERPFGKGEKWGVIRE